MNIYDIAVIGGGAAGYAAAINAVRTYGHLSAVIIERLPKTGKKILATGNGRCNLSNTYISPDKYHGSCKKFLPTTSAFDVPEFFESLGVLCEDDGYGRVYPRCRSAASVLDALRLEAAKLGIGEVCGFEAAMIEKRGRSDDTLFGIRSGESTITAKKVILAGGGRSQPSLGSNGSILDLCRSLGIETAPPFPALVPLRTDPALVRPLKGQRTEADVKFRANRKTIASQRGEVQFTEGLVSGICVFDLSYLYEQYKHNAELALDLLPDMSAEQVTALLKKVRDIRSGAASADFLSGIFTRPLGTYILKRALKSIPETAGRISDSALVSVTGTIKALTFPVTGTADFERSQVTGGGIIANELCDTFELKKIKGLYACGELLDIYGQCGGFNLDFAFSSGAAAGKYAALEFLKSKGISVNNDKNK